MRATGTDPYRVLTECVRTGSYRWTVKTCARCHEAKRPEDFYRNRSRADGRHAYCKECLLEYQCARRRARLDLANPDRRRWSRPYVQHEYFATIDDPTRAYVAGLLAADGNVLELQQRVSLELSRRDRELVHLVRDELAPGFPVRERLGQTGAGSVVFAITSPQLCADLARIGVTPRKSLTLCWPRELDPISSRSFLLGYFDGDGFITRSRNGQYLYERWALLGTAPFLTSAMQVISRETGIASRRIRRHWRNIHTLHINGADARAVDEWIHSGSSLGLARKRLTQQQTQADIAASSSSGR